MNFSGKIKNICSYILKVFGKKNPDAEEIFGDINTTRFVVLDTETTGFDYNNDRILCIGALVLQNNTISIQNSFEVYIEQEHYNKSTAQIHGILRTFILNHPKESDALQQFLDFLGDAIVVAHHTQFDITMLNNALERNGFSKLDNKTLDTAQLYKKTLLKSPLLERKDHYSLDDLAEKFDISTKDRHTALGDAFITAIAFLKIIEKLRKNKEIGLNYLFR
jgi:DNA polymerase III subunit epsilon